MHILFLADNFPPERNAQASRVYERACYWVRWGHRVTVITGEPNFPAGKLFPGYANRWHAVEEMSGMRVVRVKTYIAPNRGKYRRILDFLSYMATGFLAGLREEQPDVVAATSPQFFAGLAGCALAAVKRVPFVLEVSDLWPDSVVAVGAMKSCRALRWLERVELEMYGRAAKVVTLTGAFKKNLQRRGIAAEKVEVVINGVELSRYAPRTKDCDLARKWGLEEKHFVVGYIGTQGMAHGLEQVVRAAALARDPQLRFLFVGEGAEAGRLRAEARRLQLQNVVFVPAQAKERMPAYWSLCDVALVHLKNQPLFATVIPSKIFEAMGMGLPILLAAPSGEAKAIVEQSGAGLWVPPERPQELLAALQRLKDDEALRRTLAERSWAVAPRYSRERQAREMLAVLSQAVAGPQAAQAA